MAELKIGGLAKSRAGHDKDELYVVVGQDERYAYVCDGRYHPLDKPKRKNPKHLAPLKGGGDSFEMKLTQAGGAKDHEIRAYIRSRKQQEGI